MTKEERKKFEQAKDKACGAMLESHPRLISEVAKEQNDYYSIPNGPTASRTMRPDEQRFLTNAFHRIKDEVAWYPFHIHGEMGIIGSKAGHITEFRYSPESHVENNVHRWDHFDLHTHPPFGGPFTNTASMPDHHASTISYLDMYNKMSSYVTNGKDVLHIQPDSLELVKLNPDPKMEKKLGKFPEAFRVPDPQQPPKPFSNHEAPGVLNPGKLKKKDSGSDQNAP